MKKGISLIVLVITIIVMIILAAAIIISISNSNVINKANQAVSDSDLANIKNAATIGYSGVKLGLRDGSVTLAEGESIGERIEADLKAQGVIKDGQNVFINNYGGVEDTVVGDSATWTPSTEGNTITKYNGTNATVTIPNVVNNKKINTIAGQKTGVFVNNAINDNVEYLKLSYGIKEVGEYSFFGCQKLKSVTIPESVINIGEKTFSSCQKLENIEMPNSIKTIGSNAFAWCYALKSLTIPEGVTKIEPYVFYFCTSLKSINIPNAVTTIGMSAFRGCASLEKIVIPDSVISIGDGVFEECSSLMNIELSKNITALPRYTFDQCTSLKSITIPNSVTTIDITAFTGCSNITIHYSGSATGFPWGATNVTLVSN